MSTETESKFETAGASFYTKTWTPKEAIQAKLIFVHGFNEHINRYNSFFRLLAEEGIQVVSWDQRGWGRSVTKPAERGLTGPTSLVIADIAAFMRQHLPSEVPVFVMGHSMGGGEVITIAADPQHADLVKQIRGWILECPFIGFTPQEEPNAIKLTLGRLVGRILPKQQMKHVIPAEALSRDPAVVEDFKKDQLCHATGTLEGLASLLDRTAALGSGSVHMGKNVQSLLLAHGDADKVCSFDKAVSWFDAQKEVADKETKVYEGGYHQLHSDICKDEFRKDLVAWIMKRCDRSMGAAEAKL